ncbi:predicted ORF [Xanthomonas phage XacN1]|nr:predicted ORF [Xanthomonas phage XacN1]
MSKKYKTDKRLSQGKIIGKSLKEIILRAINPPFSLSLMDKTNISFKYSTNGIA